MDLLDDLCSKLTVVKKLTGVGVVATTVKEKFGSLRFYVSGDTDSKPTIGDADGNLVGEIIHDLIDRAESRSGQTCEECGKWGQPRNWANWDYTRCYKCWKTLMKEQYGWDIPEDEGEYTEWEEKTLEEIEKRLEEDKTKRDAEAKAEAGNDHPGQA